MSDSISRQAILDRTVNRNSVWNKITDSEGKNLEDILNSIPSTENKGEWIPVSERLPEDRRNVLVTAYWHETYQVMMASYYGDGLWWCVPFNNCGEHMQRLNPKAWMPLPEPYKIEKPETCKGCLEPCIMYEPDMRACKKKVTERGE